MTINVNDFLVFAKSLPKDSEINCRNSVSRAYYSAYHSCLSVYKPASNADGGVHGKLISALKGSPSSQERSIGFILEQLKKLRTTADYFLSENVSKADADTAIAQTEKLQVKITECFEALNAVAES
jgi:uncharacterized protein (UPF0332 family)